MKLIKLLLITMFTASGFNTVNAQTGNKVRHVVVVRSRRHHPIKHVTLHKHA